MKSTVLITGASGNLGGAVLKKFLEEDYQVAALDTPRSAFKLEETERLRSYPIDLMDEQSVKELVKELYTAFGTIDMAVFTVGGFAMGNMAETGLADFDRMYRLNFVTAYNIARQVYAGMEKQEGGGQMVFIGSRPALHPEQAKDMIAYSLTKSLVFRLAEVINEEGRSRGISASVVIPSIIDTPQNRAAMPDADFSKWVSPQDIAENIFHLSTSAGRKLRESIIKVYGDS
jgi:NAD(P)-dependent dehydrogenase (short-subunit alcohol dehydrogenase family)